MRLFKSNTKEKLSSAHVMVFSDRTLTRYQYDAKKATNFHPLSQSQLLIDT